MTGFDADDGTQINWYDGGVDSGGNKLCIVGIGLVVVTGGGGWGATSGNFTPLELGCNKAACGGSPDTCASGRPGYDGTPGNSTWTCISGGPGKHGDVAFCDSTPAKTGAVSCAGCATHYPGRTCIDTDNDGYGSCCSIGTNNPAGCTFPPGGKQPPF